LIRPKAERFFLRSWKYLEKNILYFSELYRWIFLSKHVFIFLFLWKHLFSFLPKSQKISSPEWRGARSATVFLWIRMIFFKITASFLFLWNHPRKTRFYFSVNRWIFLSKHIFLFFIFLENMFFMSHKTSFPFSYRFVFLLSCILLAGGRGARSATV